MRLFQTTRQSRLCWLSNHCLKVSRTERGLRIDDLQGQKPATLVTKLCVISNIAFTNRLEKGQRVLSALWKLFSLFIKRFGLQISFLPILMSLLPGNQNCAWKETVNDWLISLHFHTALKIIAFVNLITVSRWRGRILTSQGEDLGRDRT